MSGAKTTSSSKVTPWIPNDATFSQFQSRASSMVDPATTARLQGLGAQYAGVNTATDPGLRGRVAGLTSSAMNPALAGMAGHSAGVDGGVMAALRGAMDPNQRSAGFEQVRQNTIDSIMPAINSSFAGSGMTGSSLHQQNLAKGLASGVANVENQAYQQGLDRSIAAGTALQGIMSGDFAQRLVSAQAAQGATLADRGQALAAAQTLADLDQGQFGRQMAQIGAQAGLEQSRAGSQQNALLGLMGAATGAATRTNTQQQRPGLFGILGGGLQVASLFSDERVKEGAKRVGKMDDGTPIYTYKYKGGGSPTMMGVMAQDVVKKKPKAVTEHGGILAVDYGAL